MVSVGVKHHVYFIITTTDWVTVIGYTIPHLKRLPSTVASLTELKVLWRAELKHNLTKESEQWQVCTNKAENSSAYRHCDSVKSVRLVHCGDTVTVSGEWDV